MCKPNVSIYSLLFLLISFHLLFAQYNHEKSYVKIAPGKQYEAGAFHRFFFGDHWRDLWTTPIEVEVLNLEKFDGGLIPIKKGGGMQTKSLRLLSGNNKVWKFRSMNKYPSKILPKVLQKTIAADILQDQISSANPLAALVVVPILDAVDIIQAKPILCVMPDDPKLGEFQAEFCGLLGMIEIHPKVDDDEGIEFEGAEKVEGTLDLFDRLAEKHSEKYDSREYLKARLIDIFLGDWDRHTDQWKWAKYTINGIEYWKPIPRDRDQAFAKFDGLGVRIAEYLVPQFNHFGYEYPQIEDITWSGRFIDRRVLPVLTEQVWDSITYFVTTKITDDVIDEAVRALPDEHYNIAANELLSKLKYRRDKIENISKMFYEFINDVVDVYCSDDEDYVLLNRINDAQTEVTVFRRDEDSNIDRHEKYYYKLYDNNLTSEIRIHLMDKDDKIELVGDVNRGPLVRIIGGDGSDKIIDDSNVNGYLFSILPVKSAENKTIVYDSGKKTKITFGSSTIHDDTKFKEPEEQLEKYEPQQRDRHSDWLVNPVISLSSDNGLIIGGGPQYTKYDFRKVPFDYWMTLTAHYASKPNTGTIEYTGIFNSLINGTSVKFNLLATGLRLTNYYGFGNQTDYEEDLDEEDYYELEQGLLEISSSIKTELMDNTFINIGLNYTYSDIELHNTEVLNEFNNYYGGEYGRGIHESIKGLVGLCYDSRDKIYHPYKGMYLSLNATVSPKLLDTRELYHSLEFDLRSYYHLNMLTDVIVASRIGGGKTFGNYPFFDSRFLGGEDNLRGYVRERFSGDAVLFGQLELRALVGEVRLIIPGNLGLHTFIETGRVFAGKENSNIWHPSYGGGFWLSYLDRMLNLSVTLAHSTEGYSFWFMSGMMF